MTPSQIHKDDTQVDPAAWVDQYGDYLYRYAVPRVASEEDAEDLVQETFLSALEAFADFRRDSSVRTWLFSILRRKIIDYYRKKGHRDDHEIDGDYNESADFYAEGTMKGRWKPEAAPRDWRRDPEAQTETEGFMQALHRCIKQLSSGLAAVFTLRELEEMETDAICKELEITSSNLWVRLHRARKQIRHCLEQNWIHPDTVE
ncbi:MAG: RNA polymerase sigma factor YlaC [Candidatus Marinimicrobia bacterium]|nr:RNA polymerase sigma factor YlaC [Candidatus Neomarinimicrobiota bacterium]